MLQLWLIQYKSDFGGSVVHSPTHGHDYALVLLCKWHVSTGGCMHLDSGTE